MPITINGSGTLTGLSAGGLPDDSVNLADLSATGTTDATTLLRGDNTWAVRYPAVAWASVDGDAGTLAFHAEQGFASIADSGAGNYQATLDTALADTNGAIVAGQRIASTGAQQWLLVASSFTTTTVVQLSTRLVDNDAPSFAAADMDPVHIAVFR